MTGLCSNFLLFFLFFALIGILKIPLATPVINLFTDVIRVTVN